MQKIEDTKKNLPHLSPHSELDSGTGMVREETDQGNLTVFRKPKTPDPFVNAKLTSVGCNSDGVERFWISCVNIMCGTRSFLIDEKGRYRLYQWPSTDDSDISVIYSVAPADADTLWLCGGRTPFFIRLTLSTGKWKTYPRKEGNSVTSGVALDQNTGKLFLGARTAMISFDTCKGTNVRVYEKSKGEMPPECYQYDSWQNSDGSYGFIMSTPGLSYLRWDPKTESVTWKRLTDDPQHPAIPLILQLKYVDGGRVYLPHLGWLDGLTGEISPHDNPPQEEACWFGYQNGFVYGIQTDNLNNSGRFIRWDPSNGSVRFLFTVPGTNSLSCALSQSGKIILVDLYGMIRIYDAESGLLEVTRKIESEREHIGTIIPVDEDRILGFPYISSNFWDFNTNSGKGVYAGRAAAYCGQVDCAIKANGKVYFAAYVSQQLVEFDPEKPVCFPRNPHLVAHGVPFPPGGHGRGITTDGTVVWAAFTPRYGTLDGIMIRYDTKTGETRYKIGAVSEQHIRYPMYDPAGDRLIGGTSVLSDGQSATAVHDRAFAVILNSVTMEVEQKVAAPVGVTTLEICGPLVTDQWLMQSGHNLFVFDTKALKLNPYDKRERLPEGTVGQVKYTGEVGKFVVQIGDKWYLWSTKEDTLNPIASQEPGFVYRWWIHGPNIYFDCGRFVAVLKNWKPSH